MKQEMNVGEDGYQNPLYWKKKKERTVLQLLALFTIAPLTLSSLKMKQTVKQNKNYQSSGRRLAWSKTINTALKHHNVA